MPRPRPRALDPETFGLTRADLDAEFFTGSRIEAVPKRLPLREILGELQQIYAGTVGAEFAHISNSEERLWLQDEFQQGRLRHRFTTEEQRNLLWQLTAAEGLERYLHTRYVGQKRFSLEGTDALIPLLDDLVQRAGDAGVEEVVIGMHKVQERPMVVNGQVAVRPMMYLAVTYDHRIIDGREAVQFLVAIKEALEDPGRMLLGI